MRITPKKVIISLTMGAFAFCGAGVAAAFPASGGDWVHGSNSRTVWSNYWHPAFNHASSVDASYYADSGCVGPGQWSRAAAPRAFWGGNKAYYRFC